MADVQVDPVDPKTNLQKYINEWTQANNQYNQYHEALIAALAKMLQEAKDGHLQAAFQDAEMVVMPGAMNLEGGVMGQLAGSMNIASALQEFTTDSQNAMNAGTKITDQDEAKFVNYIEQFYAIIKHEMGLPKGSPNKWIDNSTGQNLLNSIDKICEAFGYNAPNANGQFDPRFTAANVGFYIYNWTNNPTGTSNSWDGKNWPNPGNPPMTGQQCLQNLQAGFTQWNNTESAQSQGLQAQEQFVSNTYQQYMNTCTGFFQAMQKQFQSMVQNQKSQ